MQELIKDPLIRFDNIIISNPIVLNDDPIDVPITAELTSKTVCQLKGSILMKQIQVALLTL